MTVTTPPHKPNRTATNTSETSTPDNATNRDRRAFMAGAAGAGATLAGLAPVSPVQAADMAMPKDLAGKTAFVTGAARGISLACADALAACGANLVILDVADQIAEVPYPLATAADLAAAQCVELLGPAFAREISTEFNELLLTRIRPAALVQVPSGEWMLALDQLLV